MSSTPNFAKCSKGLERHGVLHLKNAGSGHYVGGCPFCGKNKFYVNIAEITWDCKVCGVSGNWYSFLRQVAEQNVEHFQGRVAMALAQDRDLPPRAFREWGVGWDGAYYTIPIWARRKDRTGWFVTDIRLKAIGQPMMATPGASIGLFGWKQLAEASPDVPVFLCEGEWDAIALSWLLRLAHVEAVVVAVPGAGVLKDDWLEDFADRQVYCCYDNDGAGEKGELKAALKLAAIAKQIQFLHWLPGLPTGFDIRDWVTKGVNEFRDPKGCYTALMKLFSPQPRTKEPAVWEALHLTLPGTQSTQAGVKRKSKDAPVRPVSHEELFKEFKLWLHMQSEDPLAVIVGTVMANQLVDGDPLWLFAVAPPGGMKSELLMSLSDAVCIYSVSTLSAASLCSGMVLPGNVDPSLLPKLDKKVLIIKDFTTTLNANPNERDEIFGTLRDAYDGKFEKQFGNMPRPRRYESKFGIIAGVTPTIDSFQAVSSRLGERFLKYRFERDIDELDEEARIRRAMHNVGAQNLMRDGLRKIAQEFIAWRLQQWKGRAPIMSPEVAERIVPLAVLIARMRGTVERDAYRPELMKSRASREFGTRISKQLVMLAQGLAIYFDNPTIEMDSYRLVAQVALGSVPDKTEEVIRSLWEFSERGSCGVPIGLIMSQCRGVSVSTVLRELQDLRLLNIVDKSGEGSGTMWFFTNKFVDLLKRSGAFEYANQPISLRQRRVIRRKKQVYSATTA